LGEIITSTIRDKSTLYSLRDMTANIMRGKTDSSYKVSDESDVLTVKRKIT